MDGGGDIRMISPNVTRGNNTICATTPPRYKDGLSARIRKSCTRNPSATPNMTSIRANATPACPSGSRTILRLSSVSVSMRLDYAAEVSDCLGGTGEK